MILCSTQFSSMFLIVRLLNTRRNKQRRNQLPKLPSRTPNFKKFATFPRIAGSASPMFFHRFWKSCFFQKFPKFVKKHWWYESCDFGSMLRILENFFKLANFTDRRENLEGFFFVSFVPSDEIT